MRQYEYSEAKKILDTYKLQHIPYVEHIWGHRFRNDQTPMLILLELMCVIENQFQAKKSGYIEKVFSPENKELYFNHRRNFKLRRLLYQNEILESIYRLPNSEVEKWKLQIDYLKEEESENFSFSNDDVEHLKNGFNNFDDYYNSISILSSLTYDPLSKKRWTSRFVFPINEEFIWNDFDHLKESEDRRFFSRGGEILYLMLCRANVEVREKLESIFEDWIKPTSNDAFTKLARSLTRPEQRIPLDESKRKKLGFLPYSEMQVFDTLAEDLQKVLSHEKVQQLDKIKIISDLIGYHLGNYIYTVGSDIIGNTEVSYISEVLTKTTNSIRKASIQSISVQRNRLKQALSSEIPKITIFYDKEDIRGNAEQSIQDAESYLSDHISGYPQVCFRHIGFVSRKNTRSYRYVVTENFLHSLVITILGNDKRMELKSFVYLLRDRYKIYIDQNPPSNNDVLQSDLNKNFKNLSNLLYQMGMLRHLSDACSYVLNPYSEDAI